ncbi:hypothetical protein [Levilactobacillus parabrevis]|uniref:Integral membrane protein n=1 Tax=Levilactobacillus parabrevis ATCC 53295 TaxID=1267003 RepID=A0A0R1GU94_9LACO|nr:hypothetical protein [Levilactobacillus parabrevis]KRK37193.1 hypothetical protein FD07_GL000250 [Levilactobacillus parabrevis ATCC 53295]KRO06311.1 hypothetical protein IV61_GL000344 [Levilactobacillus parabrevis]
MEFQQRLPQNLRETVLFMAVISVISVNIIAPIITGLEVGFSLNHWIMVLHQIPLLWVSVIILVVLTQQPAGKLASYFLDRQSGFRSAMLITTMCNVFLMSLVLTILGTWIGTGQMTLDPIVHFFAKWPRNFTIALIVEAFIAQPIARSVMALGSRSRIR